MISPLGVNFLQQVTFVTGDVRRAIKNGKPDKFMKNRASYTLEIVKLLKYFFFIFLSFWLSFYLSFFSFMFSFIFFYHFIFHFFIIFFKSFFLSFYFSFFYHLFNHFFIILFFIFISFFLSFSIIFHHFSSIPPLEAKMIKKNDKKK